jgi:hypothetical protein
MTANTINDTKYSTAVEGGSLATMTTTVVEVTRKVYYRVYYGLPDMEAMVMNLPLAKRTKTQRRERKASSQVIKFTDAPQHTNREQNLQLSDLNVQSAYLSGMKDYIKSVIHWRKHIYTDSLAGRFVNLTDDQDEIVNVIECQMIFFRLMWTAKTPVDQAVAIATYSKLMDMTFIDYAIPLMVLTSAWDWLTKDEDTLNVQSFEFPTMPDLRSFLDYYDAMKGSKMYEKLYKFCMYGLSLSLFKPIGIDMDYMKYDAIAQTAINNKYHMGVDFCYTILDTVLFICERGYQCYVTGSIQPIFHSELKYQKWFDRAEKLSRQSHFLSNPTVHNIDRFSFLSDLKDVIEQGQSMKRLTPRKEDKLLISKMLTTLELVHDSELTKRASQKERPAPFCLLLYGGSSIGKSTLTNLLFQHYGKVRNLNTSSEFKYTRNPTEEYWSNFNSTQWCVVMDDIGFMAPQLGTMDPSLAEMLCVANNVPFVPAQAELHDKGRTPVRAELVIGSTNTENLNLHAYFSCPLAVQRRFPYVLDVVPKKIYADPLRPQMLDSARVPPTPEGEYPDYWEFTLKRVIPAGTERQHQQGTLEDIAIFTSMKDLIRWYTKAIEDHNTIQEKVLVCGKTMNDVVICGQCKMPNTWCECLNTQSSEYYDSDMSSSDTEEEETLEVHNATLFEDFQSYLESYPWYYQMIINYYLMWYAITARFEIISLVTTWFWGYGWFWSWICTSKHKSMILRTVIGYIGKKNNCNFDTPIRLIKISAAITSLLALYKGISAVRNHFRSSGSDEEPKTNGAGHSPVDALNEWQKLSTQGAKVSVDASKIGVEPVPDQPLDYIYQHPYTDKYALSSADLTPSTACSKGKDPEPLMRQIASATVSFRTLSEGVVRVTTAVNVRGCVYMCNYHAIPPSGSFLLDVIANDSGSVNSSSKRILVTPSMVFAQPDHDLAFIHLKCRPPGKDLTGYFTLETFTGKLEGTYIGRDATGKSWRLASHGLFQKIEHWLSHGKTTSCIHWRGKVDSPTRDGDCGMLLFANAPAGHMILGIHTLGKDTIASAMRVTQNEVRHGCDQLEPVFVNSGVVKVSAPSQQRWLSDLSPQSVIHGTKGTANPIGSFSKEFRQRPRTMVSSTLICASMLSRGYNLQKTKPDMSRKPWRLALDDMTRPVVLLRNDILDACLVNFTKDVYLEDLSQVKVYSMTVAVNGKAGVRYCDQLPRKTSAGCPYKCPKKKFLHHVDGPVGSDWVMPSAEIVETCSDIITTYIKGDRYHPIFCGHLKDEPVTFQKAKDGKTRVFTASPMAWTIVVRMYLMGVIMHIQSNRFIFESGPGVVAQSLEWEEIRQHLTKFGDDRIVAGDYAKFDKRMPANVILAAFQLIASICERAGYSPEDLAVVRGIGMDTAFPVVDFNGDLIEFFGSNPSGHPLTVIVNGIANCLYMRYCYTVLNPLQECESFQKNVALMTYGDDNIMGVSKDTPWFNHTEIVRVLAEVDIGYTMADKDAESVPYIHIDESNFLKRTWRFDDDIGAYVAVLDHSSIEKMTTVCVAKGNISPQQHSIAVISTAIREYFWYGRQIFEEKKQMFLDVISENNLDLCVEDSTFPTWEELYRDFWDNSKHITLDRM